MRIAETDKSSSRLRLGAVAGAIAVLAFALAHSSARSTTLDTKEAKLNIDTFAKGLEHPWGLALLPDGRMLVTERPGRLRLVGKDGTLSEPLQGVPEVYASGQGGLLDVALDPDFKTNKLVYLTYAEPRDGGAGTAVARGVLTDTGLDKVEVIFRQVPPSTAAFISARGSPSRRTANCSSRLASASSSARRRTCPTISARSYGSTRTARSRRTIPSSAKRMRGRRSGPTAIGTRKAPPYTPRPENSGRPSSVPRAATSSTFRRRARIMVGRWWAGGATMTGRRSQSRRRGRTSPMPSITGRR